MHPCAGCVRHCGAVDDERLGGRVNRFEQRMLKLGRTCTIDGPARCGDALSLDRGDGHFHGGTRFHCGPAGPTLAMHSWRVGQITKRWLKPPILNRRWSSPIKPSSPSLPAARPIVLPTMSSERNPPLDM